MGGVIKVFRFINASRDGLLAFSKSKALCLYGPDYRWCPTGVQYILGKNGSSFPIENRFFFNEHCFDVNFATLEFGLFNRSFRGFFKLFFDVAKSCERVCGKRARDNQNNGLAALGSSEQRA
jgi:hypothetical protein